VTINITNLTHILFIPKIIVSIHLKVSLIFKSIDNIVSFG